MHTKEFAITIKRLNGSKAIKTKWMATKGNWTPYGNDREEHSTSVKYLYHLN